MFTSGATVDTVFPEVRGAYLSRQIYSVYELQERKSIRRSVGILTQQDVGSAGAELGTSAGEVSCSKTACNKLWTAFIQQLPYFGSLV